MCNAPLKRALSVNAWIAFLVFCVVMIEIDHIDPDSPYMFWLMGIAGLLAVSRFQRYVN